MVTEGASIYDHPQYIIFLLKRLFIVGRRLKKHCTSDGTLIFQNAPFSRVYLSQLIPIIHHIIIQSDTMHVTEILTFLFNFVMSSHPKGSNSPLNEDAIAKHHLPIDPCIHVHKQRTSET